MRKTVPATLPQYPWAEQVRQFNIEYTARYAQAATLSHHAGMRRRRMRTTSGNERIGSAQYRNESTGLIRKSIDQAEYTPHPITPKLEAAASALRTRLSQVCIVFPRSSPFCMFIRKYCGGHNGLPVAQAAIAGTDVAVLVNPKAVFF